MTHVPASRAPRLLGGEPADLLLDDGVDRRRSAPALAAAGAEVVDADGLVALPGLVDLHTHLREPGREDAETVETGTARRRARRLHRRARDGQHRPGRRHRRRRRAGLAARPRGRAGRRAARSARSPSGWRGERLAELGAMADSAARVRVFSDDGHCVADARADAPGAGVRQGVRRRRSPSTPQEPRLTEGAQMNEGELSGRLGLRRLAGGRRGGDHRPRRAARRARRLPAARLPRLDRRLGGDPALGQGARACEVTAEVTPHHLLLTDELADELRPGVQGQPAAAHRTRTSQALRAGAGRRHDRRGRHRPRPARRARTRRASGPRPRSGMLGLETALSVRA